MRPARTTHRALRALLPILTVAVLGASSGTAHAKLVEVWGSGLGGYGWGTGNGDNDFYRWVRGGAGGFEVGVKILFSGAFVDYLRWFGGDAGANMLSFNIGGDWTIDLSKRWRLVIRGAGGYYLGTLPSDVKMEVEGIEVTVNDQVNTRGVGARVGVGLRYEFWKVFSVGITPELGYHYFFGGAEEPITQTDNNSSGFDVNILAHLRVGFGF
jgi:hypothetical protein